MFRRDAALKRSGPAVEAAVRAVPVALAGLLSAALAWYELGSFRAADWLPYAIVLAFVVAAVLASGAASQPPTLALAGVAALFGLAIWDAISISWSPLPAAGRDEALRTALYALALALPLLTLRTVGDRVVATTIAAAGPCLLALATVVELRRSATPGDLYAHGRLDFPVTYTNGVAAAFLLGFWPAIAIASTRTSPLLLRVLALSGATLALAGWIAAQSKGAGAALIVSALVFFAVCGERLRAVPPTLLAGALAAVAFRPLTAPFRAPDSTFAKSVHDTGGIALVLAATALVIGLVYSVADRRIEVRGRTRAALAALTVGALVAGVAAGTAIFLVRVDHPGHYFAVKWEQFKHYQPNPRASSHFGSLGSSRYDLWRVAWHTFEGHPLAGVGSAGFFVQYLEHRRTPDEPQDAHMLELDALAETGVIGFALLAAGLGLPLAAAVRNARRSRTALAAAPVAGFVYFLVHTSVDWIWSVPAVGLPALLLLGIGAAGDNRPLLAARAGVPAAAAAAAVAVLAFAPPWLAARYVDRAYAASPSGATRDLRWARRLDPLSTEPLEAESALARRPRDIEPLRRAVEMQPKRFDLRLQLALLELRAGRRAEARRNLEAAHRLNPSDRLTMSLLRKAR